MNPISIEFKDESMQALQADLTDWWQAQIESGTAEHDLLTLILTVGACVAYQTAVDVDELDGQLLMIRKAGISARQASTETGEVDVVEISRRNKDDDDSDQVIH